MKWRALLLVAAATSGARADDELPDPARPLHGSISIGGSLLATGQARGSHLRAEVEVDLEPFSRYGALVALRAADADHRGLLCAGLLYEGAAARPKLVLSLHVELGADLDQHAPVVGGGVRAILFLVGPLAVSFDGGTYVVIDGVDHSRLVLSSAASVAAAW